MVTRPKRAVVTGAGSGIGRAIALRLASDGATVGLIDRNQASAIETLSLVEQAGGCGIAAGADVRGHDGMIETVNRLAEEMGGLDAAVSAAGIARLAPVHMTSEQDWDDVIDVNLKGTFLLAKAAVPHLLRSGSGAFVAISSDAGFFGAQDFSAYCASKHGVIGLVKSMALDYGQFGLRSNAVCPGFVETPMATQIFDGAPQTARQAYRDAVPLKRFARPEEVAAVVAHFASSEASYSNGCVYLVDGGSSSGFLISAS